MKFYGKIVDGILKILKRQEVYAKIKEFGDGFVEIEMKHKKQRSSKQNRYLHGVLIPEFRKALNECGYDEVKDDYHAKEVIKAMFLTRHYINENSDLPEIPYVKDTSMLTTVEMNQLYDEVIRFCAKNMNYQIPYPNEELKLDI